MFFCLMWLMTLFICGVLIFGFYTYQAYTAPFAKALVRLEGDYLTEQDPEIGFIPKKNGVSRRVYPRTGMSYTLFSDDRGARVNAPGEKTPDRVDLVTLGGSFAWGHGIENEETFTQLLAKQAGLTVANLAKAGYGTVQALQMLQRNTDLRPRLVIYAIIEDHLNRNISPCAPSYSPFCTPVAHVVFDEAEQPSLQLPTVEHFPENLRRKFMREVVFSERIGLADILWKMRVDFYNLQKKSALRFLDTPERRSKALSYLLDAMIQEVHAIEATLLVVYIPTLERDTTPPPSQAMVQALEGRPLEFINLEPVIRRYYQDPDRPLLRLKEDGHPSVAAHNLITDNLYAYLEALAVVEPAGEGQPRHDDD